MDSKNNLTMSNPDLQNTTFKNAMIGMLVFSFENKVLQYNREAKAFFNKKETLKGKSINDLFIFDSPLDLKKIFPKSTRNSHWENILRIGNENKEITSSRSNRECQYN